MRYDVGGLTDAGPLSYSNDDHLLLDFHLNLFAVLDAGGSWAEDRGRASRIGAEVIQEVIGDRLPNGDEPRSLIERAFRAAHARFQAGDENGFGLGASVVLALLVGDAAHVGWLGDSLAYHVSAGRVERLTRPHTWADHLVRHGQLSEAEAATDKHRHFLLHCLGGDVPDTLEVITLSPRPGDWLVLTTDGVHDHVSPAEFAATCRDAADAAQCAASVVHRAHAAGSRDNATCAAIAFCQG